MEEQTIMSDKDMLMLAYGALKAISYSHSNAKEVVEIIEEHLFPPTIIFEKSKPTEEK